MTRVAIIGAGIAGLTLALAAHRAGLTATVYERGRERVGPRDTDGEAGLQLGPNAVRVLERLGAGPALHAVSCHPVTLEFLHWRDGTPHLRVPIRPAYADRFGAEHVVLRRADLRHVLNGLLPPGTVRADRRCVAVDERPDLVRAMFADGPHVDADVVVGADGLHSTLRAHVGAGGQPLVHSGNDVFRALAPTTRALPATSHAVRLWLGPDRHFLTYPVDRGRHLNVVAVIPAVSDAVAGPPDRATPVEDLAAGFAAWDPAVGAILRTCPPVHRRPLYDREPLATWSTDRVTLIGDAAHPMLPHQAQGACQAIEDADTLATLLAHADRTGVPEALRRLQALRAPRTAYVQARSREFGRLMHSPEGAELIAGIGPDGFIDLMTDTYAHDPRTHSDALARRAC